MSVALVTGAAGLVGSETARHFHGHGLDVVGIDNDMRAYFFGQGASVRWNEKRLRAELPNYEHHSVDIRDSSAIDDIVRSRGRHISAIVHCAAQPSHDWAAREPVTDFSVNAVGTLTLLEAARKHSPEAAFILVSTNKVYGDSPNRLPLVELEKRWELPASHPWGEHGIDESMSIDQTTHSLFGASKVAADVLVQEYGRYFGMRTAVFRGGCLTGPAHSGAELHGFLAYLVQCAVTGRRYTIFGYKGKQVRDNIHSTDLVRAFWEFVRAPRSGAVYNIGGSRHSNCSVLEAIDRIAELRGRPVEYELSPDARTGDHIWWISDVRRFRGDYPGWEYDYDLDRILPEIIHAAEERYGRV